MLFLSFFYCLFSFYCKNIPYQPHNFLSSPCISPFVFLFSHHQPFSLFFTYNFQLQLRSQYLWTKEILQSSSSITHHSSSSPITNTHSHHSSSSPITNTHSHHSSSSPITNTHSHHTLITHSSHTHHSVSTGGVSADALLRSALLSFPQFPIALAEAAAAPRLRALTQGGICTRERVGVDGWCEWVWVNEEWMKNEWWVNDE